MSRATGASGCASVPGVTRPAEHVRIPWSGGALDADHHPGGSRGAVVAPPHPEYGGARSNPVVRSLVDVLVASGRTTVAFDWRGVGASDGRVTGDPAAALEDYAATATWLRNVAPGPWVAAGYSFGAATALRVAATDPRVEALVLVAPPVAMTGTEDLVTCRMPLGVVVGDRDDFAPAEVLEGALRTVPTARLEVLAGVDHFFFDGGLRGLGAALERVLPGVA